MTDTRVTLGEVIRRALDARLADVRTALPARVEAYDAAAQTVDVKPMVKSVVSAEDGELVESLPVLPSVPLMFPRLGTFFVTFPVAVGDTVLVVFCDRSLDEWRAGGTESEPADLRMHSLSDAVAIPGLYPGSAPMSPAPHATNMVMGNGAGQIHITPAGEVHLGQENAPGFVALAPAADDRMAAIETKLNEVITALAALTLPVSGATAGPPPPGTFLTMSPGSSVAATKVKGL